MDPTSTLRELEFAGYTCWGLLSRVCLSRWQIGGSNIHIEGARICWIYLFWGDTTNGLREIEYATIDMLGLATRLADVRNN